MDRSASRVILLGGSGFIGRALSTELDARGAEVHGYSSTTLDLRTADALSVLDPLMDDSPTLIFSSAITPDRGRTLEALSGNTDMIMNVARYLQTRHMRKVVYISSDAIFGWANPVTEDSPVDPADFYALSKVLGERVLQLVCDSLGVPVLVLRPVAVYGPGDSHNSYGPNRFVRSAVRDGRVRMFGDGEELRDHIYIDDLARISADLIASDVVGAFNVATGESRTFGAIVDMLQAVATFPIAVEHAPRGSVVTHRWFDTAKLARELPNLSYLPLEEGLRRTLAAVQATRPEVPK